MTDESFSILPGELPDELDVELLMAGAVSDPTDVHRIREAMSSNLADVAAELDAARAAWARRPDLPGLSSTLADDEEVVAPDSLQVEPANNRKWWMSGLVGLAAGTLLAIGTIASMSPVEDEGIRSMGTLPVDAWTVRAEQRLADPVVHRAGDQVFLRFASPREGHASVSLLQDDGRVTVLQRTPEGAPLHAGQTFSLDGAVQLDAETDREWLVVTFSDDWQADAVMSSSVSGLLPDPVTGAREEGWWAREITRR